MENTTLDHAISVEGSARALAKVFGLNESTVSNWRKRGTPKTWGLILKHNYAKRKPKNKK